MSAHEPADVSQAWEADSWTSSTYNQQTVPVTSCPSPQMYTPEGFSTPPFVPPTRRSLPARPVPSASRNSSVGMWRQNDWGSSEFGRVDTLQRVDASSSSNPPTPSFTASSAGNISNISQYQRNSASQVDLRSLGKPIPSYGASSSTTIVDPEQRSPGGSRSSPRGSFDKSRVSAHTISHSDLNATTRKPLRDSNATTLRSSRTGSYHTSPEILDGELTPTSFQIGRHTYLRHETQPDLGAQAEKQLPDKPRKGKPGGPPLALWHEILFVLIIAKAQALMLAGVSQALIPAKIIGDSFGLSKPADLAWFSAAYALTSGTFVLPAGRLGDLFGHRKIFILGFFWFAIWSLITGFALRVHQSGANGVVFFNVCRAIQGIGPALQVPNGQAMLGRAYTPGPRKALVMSLFGASAPFGFVAGGAMASMFAQVATWPWAFWVLAIVCLLFGTASIFILPSSPTRKIEQGESMWVLLDGRGILLGVTGLVFFNFSWNQAAQVSWRTPYTYFLLIISILLLAAFIYAEMHAAHPLVPISAMQSHTNFVLACTAAGWGCFSVWVFYSFQFLEDLRGWTPLLAAASHSPGPVTGLIASLLVARYMMRLGPHWIMLISMCAFFAGSLLMATAPVGQTYWANTLLSVLIMPFGMDMSNPAATILMSNSVAREHQGIAASLVVTVVNYSISTALGFAATIETQVNRTGDDVLRGFRGAQYFGVGLGVLGVVVALAFALSAKNKSGTAGPPSSLSMGGPPGRLVEPHPGEQTSDVEAPPPLPSKG
ncbi:uncharacterized protein JN550_009596 [Neoarthrinium moseri]|uniref:uncharacterized protein n=1 Tax=Neoarthrinium moseri TaxID=1658444 RepID=UPI001FDB2F24|nr:uncharacterized protein JN550_009596 [Neoarthrinium moseri]KAI1863485.1 hypothetical protein JN550_009596 [Neoarthrinium moseri]